MAEMLLNTIALAVRWGMSSGTLENWRRKNKGPKFIKLGRSKKAHVVYKLEDVIEYEKKMSVKTNG